MTRFWITLDQGVDLVLRDLQEMSGGEVFIPKIPSMNILDLAEAIAPDCEVETIGIRPGEKLHEVLISEDESRQTVEIEDMYIITPAHPWWSRQPAENERPLDDGFRYSSETNEQWLSVEELRQLAESVG